MNNSPMFSENLFMSPLLQHQEPSPYINLFHNNWPKLSDDLSDLLSFKLQDLPLLPAISLEESPLVQQHNQQQKYHPEIHFEENQKHQELEEFFSPNISNRCQIPSTKFQEIHQQIQPPFLQLSTTQDELPQIESLINFLVIGSKHSAEKLQQQFEPVLKINPLLYEIFKILIIKFKKLHKTKEEMTKYCMRKAFKYVSQNDSKEKCHFDLDSSMREYFTQSPLQFTLSMPFKKNSAEKTMNGAFLRRIFSCPGFKEDYRVFLQHFQEIMLDDNQKKTKYLAGTIKEALKEGHLTKIQKIKRLPWTKQILEGTLTLAFRLGEHCGTDIGRRKKK